MYFLLCVLFFSLCLFYNYLYDKRAKSINRIQGPAHLPFIGNLHQVSTDPHKIFETLTKWNYEYYPIYKIWMGPKPIIIINHPDDLKIILSSTKHIDKNLGYEHLEAWLKQGLIISTGNQWQQRRKLLTKAFHFHILKKYVKILHERAENLVIKINKSKNQTIENLLTFFSSHTLDIICESTMGISLHNSQEKSSAILYREAIEKMSKLIVYRIIRPYIREWMLPLLPKLNKENKKTHYDIEFFTNKIIKERKEYLKKINYASFEDLNVDEISDFDTDFDEFKVYDKEKKLSMLDLLLHSKKNGLIDDQGIKDEITTFVFEGHDTTASGLCFLTMLLAENKNVQDRARAEVEEIYRSTNKKLRMLDLQKMSYLEECIHESLRLFPSVPFISRYLTEDVQLKHCRVPKGTNVFINIFMTHRNLEFWPEPEKFDPDRFLQKNIKTRHPFSYLPFSAGPRNCIGQKFAMMELKSTLANILYNYYLEPISLTEDLKLIADIILRASTPIQTKFIKINRK